jgi:isocitrate lyase
MPYMHVRVRTEGRLQQTQRGDAEILDSRLEVTTFSKQAVLRARGNIDVNLCISQFETLYTLISRNFEDGKRAQTLGCHLCLGTEGKIHMTVCDVECET